MVKCPGTVIGPHGVVPQPPADAAVDEQGTCNRCACRYQVVAIHPTVLGLGYDEYVEALHAQLASIRDALQKVLDQHLVDPVDPAGDPP